jgi:hypothetical protein
LQPVAMQWFADVELGCNVLLDVWTQIAIICNQWLWSCDQLYRVDLQWIALFALGTGNAHNYAAIGTAKKLHWYTLLSINTRGAIRNHDELIHALNTRANDRRPVW